MLTTCGFCNEPLAHNEVNFHDCSEIAYFEQDLDSMRYDSYTFNYGPLAIAEAEAFLKAHPEFNDQSVTSYTKVAKGLSPEQQEFVTPNHIDCDDLPIENFGFDNEWSREDEWQGIYELREQLPNLSNWRDVEPKRCTVAYHWWTADRKAHAYTEPNRVPTGFYSEESYVQQYEALDFNNPRLMRLEFNDLKAFTSELLINADITEAFQYKVFNAFIGRDQKFHIGLLTFEKDSEKVSVTCKHNGCYYRNHAYSVPLDIDRTYMEDFVLNCIRHGNNHGPDWLVKRKDFTFIHANNCDTNHGRSENCNANQPRIFVNELNSESFDHVFNFLIHHRKFCTNSDCRCTHYYHLLNERNYAHA